MDTPTSLEAPASRQPIEAALPLVGAGDLSDSVVDAFSDLSLVDARHVRPRWSTLPVEQREGLVRRAVEWAESDVSKAFGRLLRIAIADPVATVRQLAVIGLWEDPRPDLPSLLMDIVEHDPNLDVRAEAVGVLSRQLEESGMERFLDSDAERLRELLLTLAGDEEDPSILRRAAVAAVGGLGDDDEADPVIRFAATDDDAALQAAALYAMGTTRDEAYSPIVVESLDSHDLEVRTAATRAVGMIGIHDAVESIVAAAGEEDEELRRAAIGALGALGNPAATRVLRAMLQEPDPLDAAYLEAALDEAMILGDTSDAGAER